MRPGHRLRFGEVLALATFFVFALAPTVNADVQQQHSVKQILLDGKEVASASTRVVAPDGRVENTISRDETIVDGTRVDVPAHVLVVIVRTDGKSTATLEPGASITFVSTGQGELIRSNTGKTVFDVVHGALDFFRVQYGDQITAGVSGTTFSVDATGDNVTIACQSDVVSLTKSGFVRIGATSKAVSLIDVIPAGGPAATYVPSGQWDLTPDFADAAAAVSYFQTQAAQARAASDPLAIGAALLNLGTVQEAQDQSAAALQTYQQALAPLHQAGDFVREASTLSKIGTIQEAQGAFAPALASYQQALAIYSNVHYLTFLSFAFYADIDTLSDNIARVRLRMDVPASPPAGAQALGHQLAISTTAFSFNGKRLVTASYISGTTRVWDLTTGLTIRLLRLHRDWTWVNSTVRSAAFSPDGTRVLTAQENDAQIWDAQTGDLILVLHGHRWPLQSAQYSPDGKRVVTASLDGTARIWDAASGAPLRVLSKAGANVISAAFSPDGTKVVTASAWSPGEQPTVRVWDVTTGKQLLVIQNHLFDGWDYSSAAFSPDGLRLISAASDGTGQIWDAKTGALVLVLGQRHVSDDPRVSYAINSAEFSPDGGRVITASDDETARIWDAKNGTLLRTLTHSNPVKSAAFSPDGKLVVTGTDEGWQIWPADGD